MLTKVWESVGEGLAEKWVAQLGPALVFWFSGLFFWLGWQGLVDLSKTLLALDTLQQIMLIAGSLFLVMVSTNLVQRMSNSVLRFLEGYWPPILGWMDNLKTSGWSKSFQSDLKSWQELQNKVFSGKATRSENKQAASLDHKLHYVPADPNDYMPTEVGNILRMAETTPRHVYGLDAIVCWPHLWSLMPDSARKGVDGIRQQLDQASELWLWGILFVLWVRFTWWAVPIGLLWAWIAYRLSLNIVRNYADLITASFDMYRWDLYKSLHLDTPKNTKEEKVFGEKVTEYLWRGTPPKDGWEYKHPE